jgi:hypothetical protein
VLSSSQLRSSYIVYRCERIYYYIKVLNALESNIINDLFATEHDHERSFRGLRIGRDFLGVTGYLYEGCIRMMMADSRELSACGRQCENDCLM